MFRKKGRIFKIDFSSNMVFRKSIYSGGNKLFLLVTSFFFALLIIFSFNTQILNGNDYLVRASLLDIRQEYLQPQRGLFYDKDGNLLTRNVQKFDLFLKYANYDEAEIADLKKWLSDPIGLNEEQINAKVELVTTTQIDPKIKADLSSEEATILQSKLKDTNYFYFISNYKRQYLNPSEFAHIIGYTGIVDAEDVKDGTYLLNDYKGKYKLESQLEDKLRGIRGSSVNIGGIETREESQPGDNVYLTIDSRWQKSLYKIIGDAVNKYGTAGGAGVIIDNSNGNVVSLVSYPSFDPNKFVIGISNEDYQSYLTNRENPLLDKALSLQAAPGSTFKLITGYALLENNVVDENTTYYSNRCLNYDNFDFCEYHQLFYGSMNIVRAYYKSSNLFFCNNLLTMYREGNLEQFVNSAKLFNIGEKTGINLVGEVSGNMDSPEYRESALNLDWYSGDTCNAAIGQGAIVVTPIQMAMVASAVENNGTYYQPNIIEKITDVYGNIIEQPKPIIKRQIPIQQKTVDLIKEGMYDVANYWDGTVYPFLHDLPGNIKAKTGTAEAYETLNGEEIYRTHGWIVGSFDYNGKSYSFSFMLNYGAGGFYVGESLQSFINCLYSDFQGNCGM